MKYRFRGIHLLSLFQVMVPVLCLDGCLLSVFVAAESPRLNDPRLELSLFAEDPQIRTPIGMAIDKSDRVFVIESHTHLRPDGYQGPETDQVKVFVDSDQDGKADKSRVFAEGFKQALNLAFSPAGDLYVVCAREVLRLPDRDGDGRCDGAERVLTMETTQTYVHNCLLAITFDRDGWMYVSRGNTGAVAYRVVGQDHTSVTGYGDGGNVIRCRFDGTRVSEFATGFWNAFDLSFDRSGRLLLVDNDPDARGPNRLLHVVDGGDYGYKSLYGGSGIHPFQGWDGTLPGTLPYLAGTGEAPSGVIDCRRTAFSSDYGRSVLATIWNEHSIERFEIDPSTGKLAAKSLFIKGDQTFRPVAMDCDSRGNLFVTDWMLVDYQNHGRGRIWRVTSKAGGKHLKPESSYAPYRETSDQRRRIAIGAMSGDGLIEQLLAGEIRGPFERHAAVMRLSAETMEPFRSRCLEGRDDLRLVGLLASRRASQHTGQDKSELIRRLLGDPNRDVRGAALMWAAESMDAGLSDSLDRAIRGNDVTAELFGLYLSATEALDPAFIDAYQSRSTRKASSIRRKLSPRLLETVVGDSDLSDEVRALAIARLDSDATAQMASALRKMVQSGSDTLAVAAIDPLIRFHANSPSDLPALLLQIARDSQRSDWVRTHAIAAAAKTRRAGTGTFSALTGDRSPLVAEQARRSIKTAEYLKSAEVGTAKGIDEAVASPDPKWLAEGGDPLLGRHVFFSDRVGCHQCHALDGRGGTLGPGLKGIARSKSRQQIIDSILNPSAQFAPQYQAWMVLTTEGRIYRGLQLDHKAKGSIAMTLEDGKQRYFPGEEVESYRAMPQSLMPEGLAKLMSDEECRDLIAFLMSLRG